MAHVTQSTPTPAVMRLWDGTMSFFRSFGTAMKISSTSETRMREIARLNTLSDEELAAMGLTRDRIVHHVFRDIYFI